MFIFTISDLFGIAVVVLITSVLSFLLIRQNIKQARCRHGNGVIENSSCDAICKKMR